MGGFKNAVLALDAWLIGARSGAMPVMLGRLGIVNGFVPLKIAGVIGRAIAGKAADFDAFADLGDAGVAVLRDAAELLPDDELAVAVLGFDDHE